MSKRARYQSDLFSIAFFAPLVIGSRMQTMAMQTLRPTPGGQRELTRMGAEKQAAAVESFLAMQRSFMASGFKFWSDILKGSVAVSSTAPLAALEAATVPVRRRVRANSRRLTRI